jgi:SAM-dependent methyltransferase
MFRHRAFRVKRQLEGWKLRLKLVPIQIDACLRGGDSGIPATQFARIKGDPLWASRHVSEWPQVKLLREFDAEGSRLWEPGVFEKTEYYQNAAFSIEVFGGYFDAVTPDQIQWGARRFIRSYCGRDEYPSPLEPPEWSSDPTEYVSVRPIKYSSCFQVHDGHHRLAKAYMQGLKTVRGLILKPDVTTPLQDILLDVLWLKGRRELYQPIEAPEVAQWTLVRRCTDRAAKMLDFLRAENLMSPAASSYLDVACSYGWFVREMSKSGFAAEGVEGDPVAISIGQLMYGLDGEQLHRSEAINFLNANRKKFDVVSCFSLAHHFLLNRHQATAEDLLHLLDAATGKVLFFDMGEEHEYGKLAGWNPESIERWLMKNTTFARVVRLGKDEDSVPPYQGQFGRTLFACVR